MSSDIAADKAGTNHRGGKAMAPARSPRRDGLDSAESSKSGSGPNEARILAELPPSSWPQTRRRLAALAEYLRIPEPTAEDVRLHAARLQVSPVTFKRVIAAHRALQKGGEPKRSRRGQHRSLSPETAAILDDVIAEMGPNATDAAVHAEAERRAAAGGLPVASPNAIRTRRGRGRQSVDLRSRLQIDFDAIVDCCPLNFDVVTESGERGPAVLAALIGGADGAIGALSLHAGLPSGAELVALAARGLAAVRSREGEAPTLIATWTARRELEGHRAAVAQAGYLIGDASSVRLRGGSAITPVLGRAVGRAPFAMFRRADGPKSDVVLPIGLACRVLALGLDRSIAHGLDEAEPGPAHNVDRVGTALVELRGTLESEISRIACGDAATAREAADALCASLDAFISAAVKARLPCRTGEDA